VDTILSSGVSGGIVFHIEKLKCKDAKIAVQGRDLSHSGGGRSNAKFDAAYVSCNRDFLHVILNEVKDQLAVRNVSINRYCRRVILHFVQDDRQTFTL
jgi:hypothetical protein